eukprot:522519-Prorocentrum_minimum.AAC.1
MPAPPAELEHAKDARQPQHSQYSAPPPIFTAGSSQRWRSEGPPHATRAAVEALKAGLEILPLGGGEMEGSRKQPSMEPPSSPMWPNVTNVAKCGHVWSHPLSQMWPNVTNVAKCGHVWSHPLSPMWPNVTNVTKCGHVWSHPSSSMWPNVTNVAKCGH